MIRVRRADERGHADHGWLDTHYTFSFSNYYDPNHMGFRALRVMNEDTIAPGRGFGKHPHDNMEIVTYVLEGAIEHRDSLGNGDVLRPGEFQRMTAGMGIAHSEFNPSPTEPAHLYQIWLLPEREGLTPSYEQKAIPAEGMRNTLRPVATPGGEDGSLTIRQDAKIYLARLDEGEDVAHDLAPGRHAWLQVLRGEATLNGQPLAAGDGAAVSDEVRVTIRGLVQSEVMLFDLA